MATTDITSSPANMHRFYEILDYELGKAAQCKTDVALIFIKIDHLDEVGQVYGRLTARRLLRKVERLIRLNIRGADRQFNYENDELMLILPNTPIDGANSMVPKLTRLIEDCPFASREGRRIQIKPRFSITSYAHDILAQGIGEKMAGNGA